MTVSYLELGNWNCTDFLNERNFFIGSIEISVATMSKVDRNHSDEVYVTSFVPHAVLPNKQPKSLDPFLEKLVNELEELFINGNCFFYVYL